MQRIAPEPAVCSTAAESITYSLSNDQGLELTTVLKDMSVNGIVKGLELVDMATNTASNMVTLSMADVLSMPPIGRCVQADLVSRCQRQGYADRGRVDRHR